jgi:hypothetical protein
MGKQRRSKRKDRQEKAIRVLKSEFQNIGGYTVDAAFQESFIFIDSFQRGAT